MNEISIPMKDYTNLLDEIIAEKHQHAADLLAEYKQTIKEFKELKIIKERLEEVK